MTNLAWWIILLVVCILLELSSPGFFFFLSFSLGAIAAAVLAYFEVGSQIEFAVFLIVSMLAFIFLTRYVKAVLKENAGHKTNVYAYQGKKAVVTETVSSCQRGWVKVDGELWSAAPINEELIEKGAIVEVVNSAGSHLIVRKIKDHC